MRAIQLRVGDFNTLLTSMDISSRQKINQEIVALNDTLGQMDFTDIHRTVHPKPAEYTLFSSAHGPCPRRDHILGHKRSVNKFKRTKYIKDLF